MEKIIAAIILGGAIALSAMTTSSVSTVDMQPNGLTNALTCSAYSDFGFSKVQKAMEETNAKLQTLERLEKETMQARGLK